ncbi:organic cation transporter protein-like isoform X1 [Haliotis rufescens]|uniref:organic cation transporter protein-like isoform X1 n=1 Tax=Haliotis rufescens TaxID=6454 RepID=UPI00201F957B|nr:organic cation transporter protein-like isoform X1 [Haliotis rufescens]
MHLESLIDDLGGFGRYQLCIIPLIGFTKVVMASSMMMMAFAGVNPGWWCESRDESSNSSSVSFENGSYKNCDWNTTCARHFDKTMDTIVTEWDLVCEKSWIGNTIISIQMAGVFVGAAISGHCSDAYGRKKVLYTALLLSTVLNVVTAFSVSWVMFAAMRLLLGFALGMLFTVNYPYQMEFVGRRYRSLLASLPTWALGVVIFAAMVWWIKHWKWLHLASAALSCPFLLGWFIVPESLRWLAVKGRLEEARSVLNKMATYNKKPMPDTSILELIAQEEKAEGEKSKSYTYKHLFLTRSLTKRTVITWYIWFTLSVVYYAISFGVRKLSGDFYLNLMTTAVLELPVMPAVLLVSLLFGRRWSCAILFFLSSFSCCGVAMANRLAPPHMKGTLENAFAQLAKFLTISAWALSQALSSEQYPTVIRNLAYASQNTVARLGGILAAQVLSLGGKDDLMSPFAAMGVLIFMNGVVTLLLKETSGRALEDTMEVKITKKPNDKPEEMIPLRKDIDGIVEDTDASFTEGNDTHMLGEGGKGVVENGCSELAKNQKYVMLSDSDEREVNMSSETDYACDKADADAGVSDCGHTRNGFMELNPEAVIIQENGPNDVDSNGHEFDKGDKDGYVTLDDQDVSDIGTGLMDVRDGVCRDEIKSE